MPHHLPEKIWNGRIIMQTRYKHKLNMLEPGGKICGTIGIGVISCILLWYAKIKAAAIIAAVLTSVVTLIFIILLIIEAHQDKVLYEDAKKENPDIK